MFLGHDSVLQALSVVQNYPLQQKYLCSAGNRLVKSMRSFLKIGNMLNRVIIHKRK